MVILVLIGAVYFTFFFTYSCDKYECFVKNLEECKLAKLLYENQDTTWLYQIKGKQDSKCEVDVTLFQIKRGRLEIEKLQGDSMTCFMPLGVTQSPERDISLCTGKLKEGLQEIIIQRLHNYILANLGQIQSELEGIPELNGVQTQINSTTSNITSVVGSNSTVN